MAGAEGEPRALVELVQGDRSIVLGLVRPAVRGDLHVIDDLLKLQVHAARLGWRVRITECRAELRELLELLGVSDRLS